MSYADYIKLFESFINTNTDKEKLQQLLELNDNPNYHNELVNQFHDVIHNRLQLSIDKIISNLEIIFDDHNYMDFILVTFKKEIEYLISMLNCKILDDVTRANFKAEIKENLDKIYDILDKKALEFDYTGVLSMMISSNKVKWS